jgi:hypothetical protein
MTLTDEQTEKLTAAGWKIARGHHYSCLVCHSFVWDYGWRSPKGSMYHIACITESPQAKKAMNK